MSWQLAVPRKRRTRKHVLADLSINHVERIFLRAGHTAQRVVHDYGYDLHVLTYDEHGYVEPGSLWLQVKAAESLTETNSHHVFDLDVRDINLWMHEPMPVFLVLFDASRSRACWEHVQSYFHHDPRRRPKKGAKTVRIRVPARQVLTPAGVVRMCATKDEALHDTGRNK